MTLPDEVIKAAANVFALSKEWGDTPPSFTDSVSDKFMARLVADTARKIEPHMRAAIASLGEGWWEITQGWRTMESAPKDGTWILAYSPNGEWARISWGIAMRGQLGWCSALRSYVVGAPFTHWMPLPAIPTDTGAK